MRISSLSSALSATRASSISSFVEREYAFGRRELCRSGTAPDLIASKMLL